MPSGLFLGPRAFHYGQASDQYVVRRSQVFLKRTVVFSWDKFAFRVSHLHIVASISPALSLGGLTDNPTSDSPISPCLYCVSVLPRPMRPHQLLLSPLVLVTVCDLSYAISQQARAE